MGHGDGADWLKPYRGCCTDDKHKAGLHVASRERAVNESGEA